MAGIPKAPAFLDPLTDINSCYFYVVPKFFPLDHANTRWLLAVVHGDRVDKLKRKMEIRPQLFRSGYFQLLDNPQLYGCRDPSTQSLFHKKAVLYLTAVGLALYFRSIEILKILIEWRDTSGEQVFSINDPQYATHVQDSVNGDFHSYPLSLVMLRGGFFESATLLLASGWDPREPICMPIRRRYERRAIYQHDWLDYALSLMQERPLLRLPKLVYYMIRDPLVRKCKIMPISVIKPKSEDDRVPSGVIDVDELPREARMIGTKSLLDVAEDYSVYLQTKERYDMVKDCIKQMVCDGVNPEVMMAIAEDFDGGYQPNDQPVSPVTRAISTPKTTSDTSNANNNAAAHKAKKKEGAVDPSTVKYVSEPTRILHFAQLAGTQSGCKTPLLPLLEAVTEYVRRNFFLIRKPPDSYSHSSDIPFALQQRDARNAIVLLLNLMQNQYNKLEGLRNVLQSDRPRFKHIDVFKHVHTKRASITRSLRRIGDLLFQMLLHSGEFLHFVNCDFPPYTYSEGGQVDFAPNPKLQLRLGTIQMEAMVEFNKSKTALSFLDMNDLIKANQMKELVLNLRLGKKPAQNTLQATMKSGKKSNGSKASLSSLNTSNLTGEVQPEEKLAAVQHLTNLLAGDKGDSLRDAIGRALSAGGLVKFVKVKRKLKPKNLERPEESGADAEGEETNAVPAKNNLAVRLAEQIAELGQTALDGTDVTRKLLEIYHFILGDLSQILCVKEMLANSAVAKEEEKDSETESETESETKPASETGEDPSGPNDAVDSSVPGEECKTEGSGWSRQMQCRRKRQRRTAGTHARRLRALQKAELNYQKVKVFDTPPGGSDFSLGNPQD